tara:strand:+ start:140 stop:322 length:183 start_codon:yes stop_codon:yes gene_type:complete
MALKEINKALISRHLAAKKIVKSFVIDAPTNQDEKDISKCIDRIRRQGKTKLSIVLIEEL